jgi:hypothetical protein
MVKTKKRVSSVAFTILLVGLLGPVFGRTIYVDCNASGENNGTSWIDAFNNLQDALRLARPGSTINVAQGSYTPDRGGGNRRGDREATFSLIDSLTLKGGFAGSKHSNPDDRDFEVYETILSGDLNEDDGADLTNILENSYHVITATLIKYETKLDGFTIQGGYADGPYPHNAGAGMHNYFVKNTIITNCTFRGNIAEQEHGSGGGMYNRFSNTKIKDCVFYGNIARRGGGMCNIAGEPVVNNCTFTGNYAPLLHGSGGGMYNGDSKTTVVKCMFDENSARTGGGMQFNNCVTDSNVTNCIFSKNTAAYAGAGIWNVDSLVNITNCTFVANSAAKGNDLGSLFTGCPAYSTAIELTNCIITDGGEAIWNTGGSVIRIAYCNILGHRDAVDDPHNAVIWGCGNIDVDPLFVVPAHWDTSGTHHSFDKLWVHGDYHLQSQAGRWDTNIQMWVTDEVTSPCIDAGDPAFQVCSEPNPNGGRVNMGAYGGIAEASKSF